VLIQTGAVLIGLGLVSELIARIYVDGRRRRIYTVAARNALAAQHRTVRVTVPLQPGRPQ
jgi:hypothetical protein